MDDDFAIDQVAKTLASGSDRWREKCDAGSSLN